MVVSASKIQKNSENAAPFRKEFDKDEVTCPHDGLEELQYAIKWRVEG
jgi:hypothetical protein